MSNDKEAKKLASFLDPGPYTANFFLKYGSRDVTFFQNTVRISKYGPYFTEYGPYFTEHGPYFTEHGPYFAREGGLNVWSAALLPYTRGGSHLSIVAS